LDNVNAIKAFIAEPATALLALRKH